MTESFGFDAKLLNNDELFSKQVELARRRVLAMRMGRADIATQLDVLIQAIDIERRERMYIDRFNMLPDSPILVETDPALREQHEAVEEIKAQEQQQKAVQANRPMRRPIRTANPIIPPDGV